MLFLVFQVGQDRYALEASRVVEIVPYLEIEPLSQAAQGVAGIFNYRGRLVPAVDLAALALGRPAQELLSTRIIVVNYPDENGTNHLLGLIAEHATGMLRKEAKDFMDPGLKRRFSPHLGPMLIDAGGPVQWVQEERWLPPGVSRLLSSEFYRSRPGGELNSNVANVADS
jgi:chemotaxis-related protein WspB